MKKCSKCGKIKPYEKFSKNKNFKDGLQYNCKDCMSGVMVQYSFKDGRGVYALWNKINKCWDYVGQGLLYDREKIHRNANCPSTPSQIKLNIWFDGWDNVYEFKVLCKCRSKEKCIEMETKYISELQPKYNTNKRQHKVEA